MRLVCVFDVFGSELLFLPAVADGFDARAAASLRRFDYFDLPRPRLQSTCRFDKRHRWTTRSRGMRQPQSLSAVLLPSPLLHSQLQYPGRKFNPIKPVRPGL
eukprot:s242_g13.t1